MAARYRTVTAILADKRRIQPETAEKLMALIESGKDVGLIEVDPTELQGFTVLPITVREVEQVSPPKRKPDPDPGAAAKKLAAEQASEQQGPDDEIRKALAQSQAAEKAQVSTKSR